MIRLRPVPVPTPVEAAFAYTADFSNIAKWDPGVVESRMVSDSPVGLDSKFELLVAFGPRRIPMTYTITAYEPSRRVVLEGIGGPLRAVDEIRFLPAEGGAEIAYTAELEFTGPVRLFFIRRVLEGVGNRALDGLAEALAR